LNVTHVNHSHVIRQTASDPAHDARSQMDASAGAKAPEPRPALTPVETPVETPADGLSRRAREILAFERQWWRYAGIKEQAIRELFNMSATRYYQILNALIDSPEAMAADPMLIKRLRRLRSSRQRARAAKRMGLETYPTPFPGARP
jgi:hypothetical protein